MNIRATTLAVFPLFLTLAFPILFSAPTQAESNVLFIFDASGSMKKKLDSGESRMDAAKKAMNGALSSIPADVRLGLLLFGHRRAKDCADIELVSPIGADDAKNISARITALDAKGETPIAESLRQGLRSYAALKGQDNRIILVTDGVEECQGNVCAAAQEVRDAGFDLHVDVVGFTLSKEQRALIECVPEVTGGKYYDAQNLAGLTTALTQVAQKAVEPPDNNILGQAKGGALLSAPNDEWNKLNDGSEKRAQPQRGEGVWAFKDGKPATFDTFEVLIPATGNENLRNFELLVGDEGPTGQFRSIGTFATQNLKMMQSPYQKFTFPAVTARYLKVISIDNWGGNNTQAFEFRLQGTLNEAAQAAVVATAPQGIDLLAAKNGGALLSAPSDAWMELNDGSEKRAQPKMGEGIWAFKDEKQVTFDTFEVLIPGTNKENLKNFELLVADESPTGPFRSIGQFATQNIKMMQSPYQKFTFPAVTTRYLKVIIMDNWGGNNTQAFEFRVIGQQTP